MGCQTNRKFPNQKNESFTVLENIPGRTLEEMLKKFADKPTKLKMGLLKTCLKRLLPVIEDIGKFKKRMGLHPKNIIIPDSNSPLKILMPTYYSQNENKPPYNLLSDFIYLLQNCLRSLGITGYTLYDDSMSNVENEVNVYKKLENMAKILTTSLDGKSRKNIQIATIPAVKTRENPSGGYEKIKEAIESL